MKNILLLLACVSLTLGAVAKDKKLVIIAGNKSHPPLRHEFRAGCLILEKGLAKVKGLQVELHTNHWVSNEATLEDADAIFIYSDGKVRHPAVQDDHLATLTRLMKKGVSLGCAHYGVEVVPDQAGKEFKAWIGGHYENGFSVNPMWKPDFKTFPKHPVTRGVKPFAVTDEWYFNMRFRDGMKGVTPILVATPSDDVRDGPYVYPRGPYPHIEAASGRKEIMMWTVERPDGGRGLGFTGGHNHLNWGNANYRKIVLNGMVWLAGLEVPKNGVNSKLKEKELYENLDPKKGLAEILKARAKK
jgi:type 1 glutamine amidotransferase